MSIEGIIKKIEAEAEAEIEKHKQETEEAIGKVEAEVEAYKSDTLKKAEEKAEVESKRRFEQLINRAEAKMRMRTLEAKQNLVAEAFDKGLEAILALPVDELRRRYAEMAASFGEKQGEIVVGKADSDLLGNEFMNILSEKIPGSDFKRTVTDDFDHGFMLIAGRIQYDARLSELFEALKERITDDVASVLFS